VHTIEIDFDVFKAITVRRETEETTANDVLRLVFKLPPANQKQAEDGQNNALVWSHAGVDFPEGTEFMAKLRENTYTMKVEGGKLMLDGEQVYSPSEAAKKLAGHSRNGWFFWFCRFPGHKDWVLLNNLRQRELQPTDIP
jgi:hypothetical protein